MPKIEKRSFLSVFGASKKQSKLAFIPQFCYSFHGFRHNDNNKTETILHTQISHRAGEKSSSRFSLGLTAPLKAAFLGATIMLSPMVANANDSAVTSDAPIQTVSIQNPYLSACDSVIEAEHKKACMDAANGTVVILRNPNEVIDPVRDGFLRSVKRAYGDNIPVEFRDTGGPTTMFMFDKSARVNQKVLTNGVILAVIGKNYPLGASKLLIQPTQG